MTGDNNVSEEITNRLKAANRSYSGLKSPFKSQLLSRNPKILIYKTLVSPLLTHTAETWTVTKSYERRLSVFKRKILHRVYGPICEKEQWLKRYNRELKDLYNELNIINIIKSSSHITQTDVNELPKILCTNPGGQGCGRPKSRIDGVEEDASKLDCKNRTEDTGNISLRRPSPT